MPLAFGKTARLTDDFALGLLLRNACLFTSSITSTRRLESREGLLVK
jgi:hypothetical protein